MCGRHDSRQSNSLFPLAYDRLHAVYISLLDHHVGMKRMLSKNQDIASPALVAFPSRISEFDAVLGGTKTGF